MNRLIIIGNGFDLAHGIKTSYHDFILDYLKTSCLKAIKEGIKNTNQPPYKTLYYLDDTLIDIRIDTRYAESLLISEIDKVKTTIEFIELYKKLGIEIKYHFKMLEKGVNKLIEYNWVDFEIEYFEELYIINSKKISLDLKIKELNSHFELFKTKIEVYLKKQQDDFNNSLDRELLCDCFCEEILDIDFDTETIASQKPIRLLFLNFNYTNTLEPYVTDCNKRIYSETNYIHGSVNDENNPSIFGFGDEIDKRYKEFEDVGNNELFKHIKSFGYLTTNNYSNLTRFLSSDKFQIQIFGHSCGLSDRTMLKEILEHENCLSVKLFYYQKKDGSDDYIDKTYELYRHFSDKNIMRKKIVDKQKCRAMPQPILMKSII